jgi:hypothetical protein
MTTYCKGFAKIFTKDDSLDLKHEVLNKIMNILEGSVKSRLWDHLVLLRPEAGGHRVGTNASANKFNYRHH